MSEKIAVPKFSGQAYIYAAYRTHVDFGIYEGEAIDETDLLELHIFNSTMEFRAVYSKFKNSFIISEIEQDMTDKYIDDKMMLYGTEMHEDNNTIAVTENGRTHNFRMTGSIEKLRFGDPSQKVLEAFNNDDCLYVRNYYAYDSNDLLYLEGYRLLGITQGGV